MSAAVLRLLTPAKGETVYPYCDSARAYLQYSDYWEEGLVGRFRTSSMSDSVRDIVLSWDCPGATSFRVSWRRMTDGEAASPVVIQTAESSLPLRNLYKGCTYRWNVEAFFPDQSTLTAESLFFTTDLGPRVLHVDGIANIRDLGGYTTADGRRTRQGQIYRSAGFEKNQTDTALLQLTEAGIRTLTEDLGIRTEMDLRNWATSIPEWASVLSYVRYPLKPYSGLLTEPETYLAAIRFFTAPKHYPIVYHCVGGADRTGTLSFCLGAILGYDDKTLINDYEYTSFSPIGPRDKSAPIAADGSNLKTLLDITAGFPGQTIAERTSAYLAHLGLTEEEAAAIRANMME